MEVKVSIQLKSRADILDCEKKLIEQKQKEYDKELAEAWRDFLEENGYAAVGNRVVLHAVNSERNGCLEWQPEGVLCFRPMRDDATPAPDICLSLAAPESMTTYEQMNYVLEHYSPIKA